ncbi:DUF4233 domain-containing protein [Georgenia thermotolerans]|uniref:DUF4233 domain-containing protein n=1 Tax=Georgenia thermotolerans TaxID=527326 RepID=A0A7J5UJ87_9MICO|nr:DUF4233 domain-containing protein [Georgenia thermotolerans]KAE8762340.1 DUF4233 domain-containing protein [Georgenia thermotolerans]
MSSQTSSAPASPAPGAPRPPGSARKTLAMSVLVSEVFIVLFASLVAFGLRLAEPGVVWAIGGAAMLACALCAGLLRHRLGYVLGSVIQALLLLSGFVLPMMFIVGAIFAVIWVVALRVGSRIDVERQERYAAELEYHRTHS